MVIKRSFQCLKVQIFLGFLIALRIRLDMNFFHMISLNKKSLFQKLVNQKLVLEDQLDRVRNLSKNIKQGNFQMLKMPRIQLFFMKIMKALKIELSKLNSKTQLIQVFLILKIQDFLNLYQQLLKDLSQNSLMMKKSKNFKISLIKTKQLINFFQILQNLV